MTDRLRLILALALLAGGCVPVGAPPIDERSSPTDRAATPLPAEPTATAALPSPSPRPSHAPAPTPTPGPDEWPDEPLPPGALLTLADGTIHAGALGSYSYGGAAADAPWLPARALVSVEVEAGSALALSLDSAERFIRWSARYADSADEDADVISQLASGGDGSTPLSGAQLRAPPRGSWVLMVQLHFADDAGDAAYYWHIVVP